MESDRSATVCVARQPILDDAGRVFGYELLYRADPGATACLATGDFASARVLTDALLGLGLETLTVGLPAFINLTRELLLDEAGTLLPTGATVLELREDIPVNPEVIKACRRLHELGYALALDDFVAGSDAEALLPWARYVKIDLLSTPAADWAALAARFKRRGLTVVAEKVESAEVAAEARAAGYRLFQGFFFCRPTTFASTPLPASRLGHLRLLAALNRENITLSDVEDLIKHDVSLSYRVLRSVNAAGIAQRQEVSSIRRALLLLGVDQIRKWASVWSLAGLNGTGTSETVSMALMRARCCELLAASVPAADPGAHFLLGLCSLLDVILQRSMAEAIAEMPLPAAVRGALLGEATPARAILESVVAYEQGDWAAAAAAAQRVGVSHALLPAVYADALRWARDLSQSSAA